MFVSYAEAYYSSLGFIQSRWSKLPINNMYVLGPTLLTWIGIVRWRLVSSGSGIAADHEPVWNNPTVDVAASHPVQAMATG